MSKQIGLFLDARRCIQCHACEVACKAANGVEFSVQWRRVMNRWQGSYPHVVNWNLSLSCLHCAQPACRDACSTGAIFKRTQDGIVIVDANLCCGCRQCYEACPYDVPQFGADGTMQMCNLCSNWLQEGDDPPCVSTCPADALAYGDVEVLAKIAEASGGQKLPGPTEPSFFVVSADANSGAEAYVAEFLNHK